MLVNVPFGRGRHHDRKTDMRLLSTHQVASWCRNTVKIIQPQQRRQLEQCQPTVSPRIHFGMRVGTAALRACVQRTTNGIVPDHRGTIPRPQAISTSFARWLWFILRSSGDKLPGLAVRAVCPTSRNVSVAKSWNFRGGAGGVGATIRFDANGNVRQLIIADSLLGTATCIRALSPDVGQWT